MRQRIAEELALLLEVFPAAQHAESGGEDWFLLPAFHFPHGWRVGEQEILEADVAFKLPAPYPGNPPYGFVAPAGINFNGSPPGNPGSAVSPPFPGQWQHFSGNPEEWHPHPATREGSNILTWTKAIAARLAEGA